MKTAYTYTVLRYVHDIATGEFLNLGVALYSPEAAFLGARYRTTFSRLTAAFAGLRAESLRSTISFLQKQFDEQGKRLREELALDDRSDSIMPIAHGVLPADSSSLQWSPPGAGLTENAEATLNQLFDRLVVRYSKVENHEQRTDDEVWHHFRRDLEKHNALRHLEPKIISVQDDEVRFEHAFKNGLWHCLEPLSFDLATEDGIRQKAHRWLGQLSSVREARERFKVYLLLGEPQRDELRKPFSKVLSILDKIPVEHEIVREAESETFTREFAREIQKHAAG